MAKASPIQSSFNAGELSPQLKGRIDLKKYGTGCEVLYNFLPQLYGPARKRPGTRFVREVKNSANAVRLVPFEYSTDQAYVLEFGNQYIRFYANGGIVINGGGPYEISSPYSSADLSEIDYAQSADVIYISHPNYPPYKLARLGATNWTMTAVTFDWPPFNDENTTSTTLTASAVTGTGITLTASASLFVSADVGSYFKFIEVLESKYDQWEPGKSISSGAFRHYDGNLYTATTTGTTGGRPPIHTEGTESDGGVSWQFLHNGAGYAKITAYTSGTSVTADVVSRLPATATSGTLKWAEGAWSSRRGYPRTVTFYEDRLWFAGSNARPQTLWASTSGDYENHQYGTNDDDALNYTINTQDMNTIQWLAPTKVLAIGTANGEFTLGASGSDAAVTPSNVRIVPQTTYGSADDVRPLRVGSSILFLQRAKRKIREYVYNFETDSFIAANMNVLAEHVAQDGIVDLSYQQEPNQIVWAPLSTGVLAGMTYERAEDVVGWHRQDVSGIVESVVTIPHWDGDQDVVWMVVRRTINGSTKRYVEYMEKYLTDEYAFYVDSGLTYDGSPTTTITGLTHLEGKTVAVLADGAVHPTRVVTSGSITLQAAASIVNVGLPYVARVKTMPLEAGATDGVSQGKTMRINNLVIRLYQTGAGLWYGPNENTLDEMPFRQSNDLMDEALPLFTGDTNVLAWPSGYENSPQVTVEHRLPTPCTIIAFMPQVHTYDR